MLNQWQFHLSVNSADSLCRAAQLSTTAISCRDSSDSEHAKCNDSAPPQHLPSKAEAKKRAPSSAKSVESYNIHAEAKASRPFLRLNTTMEQAKRTTNKSLQQLYGG
jgi:hypothetical protein